MYGNRFKKKRLSDLYWRGLSEMNLSTNLAYKCFIYAVCMVLRGNICFSGFYSDDFHVQGAERREKAVKKKKKNNTITPADFFFGSSQALTAHSATWLDIF